MPDAAPAEQAVIGALRRDNGGVDRVALWCRRSARRPSPNFHTDDAPDRRLPDCDMISVGMALADKVDDPMAY